MTKIDLLGTVLDLITAISVVTGVVFAGFSLKQLMKQRIRESGLQLLRSYQTPEFQEAVNIVAELPFDEKETGLQLQKENKKEKAMKKKKEIEELLGDKLTSLLVLFGTFEALGVLVHRREIEIVLIEDFFSGVIILAWEKSGSYIEALREISGRKTYYEWFQWLYEQVKKRENKSKAVPAYIQHKDWTP